MAADLAPPRRVFAHGWWTNEGQKISKSTGNVIDPLALIERYGLDPVRYFLMREIPFGNDGDFSRRAMVNRVNGDLANDFGNLAQRILSMIAKNCGAVMPTPGSFSEADQALLAAAEALYDRLVGEIGRQAFHTALESLWQVIAMANRYVDEQAPWALNKTDRARMGTVLYVVAEVVRRLAILTQPFMPDSCNRLLDQLAVPADQRQFSALREPLASGTALPKPTGVFPRFVETAA
jgi:methionyl-tRNA synthetase